MQPEAMGDVEVNAAFYNVSCSLWRVLVWHALLLEWIPNWGLKSGVKFLLDIKNTKTKKKKTYNTDDCIVLVSRHTRVSSLVTFIWSAMTVVPLLCGAPKSRYICGHSYFPFPKVCFVFVFFKIKRNLSNYNANFILNQPAQGWYRVYMSLAFKP